MKIHTYSVSLFCRYTFYMCCVMLSVGITPRGIAVVTLPTVSVLSQTSVMFILAANALAISSSFFFAIAAACFRRSSATWRSASPVAV